MLTDVHKTLLSVSPPVALARLQGTECDRREGELCLLPPLEVMPVVLKTQPCLSFEFGNSIPGTRGLLYHSKLDGETEGRLTQEEMEFYFK